MQPIISCNIFIGLRDVPENLGVSAPLWLGNSNIGLKVRKTNFKSDFIHLLYKKILSILFSISFIFVSLSSSFCFTTLKTLQFITC